MQMPATELSKKDYSPAFADQLERELKQKKQLSATGLLQRSILAS